MGETCRASRASVGLGGVLLVILLWFLAAPAPALSAEASVFVYHRFGDSRYPSTNISLEVFEAQLRHLEEENYTVLTLGNVVRRLRSGEALPERCAVLTVDDVYASFWEGARPLLLRFGFPVTLFVHSGAVGGPGQMTWDQLRILAGEGVEIGNHTVHHSYLVERKGEETAQAWLNRVDGEIRQAQVELARELGRTPELFAYPFGEYSPEIMAIVREVGFLGAAGQQSGVVAGPEQLFLLPRFPMGGPFATLEGFVRKLKMKHLPVEVLAPSTPLVEPDTAPALEFRLKTGAIDERQLRLFVDGRASPGLDVDTGEPGLFRARADEALRGRRSKYTLTAPGRDGHSWYWFSQLWIVPGRDDG